MVCPNKNRHRPRTLAFRCTDEEFEIIDKRVKVTGEVRGNYLREVVLNGEVHINVGKFKSDKLALALRNLTKELETSLEIGEEYNLVEKINECLVMLKEIKKIGMPEKKDWLFDHKC